MFSKLRLEMLRRRLPAMAAVAAIAALLSACSAQQAQAPAPTASATTSAQAPTTSKSVEAAPSSSPLPVTDGADGAGGDVVLGPGTVFSGCNQDLAYGDELTFLRGQVFIPALGRNVSRPVPTIPAGGLVVEGACTVAGDEDVLRVIYVYTVRTPSSGLTPESTVTQVVSFDPTKPDQPTATAVWPADASVRDFEHIVPTRWGFMAHGTGGIMGFDLNTLQRTWQSPDNHIYANREGYVTFDSRGEGVDTFEWKYRFHSAKDGAEIANSIGPSMPSGIDVFRDGFGVDKGKHKNGEYSYYYFDMRDAQFKGPIPTGGTFWGNTYTAYNSAQHPFIRIWDMDQNKEIFSREGRDVSGLNIKNLYFAGKYLYIENDSDSPVIDITTGQSVSSGWDVRPTEVINRDWLLSLEGHVTNDYFNCFHEKTYGCYEDGTLVHAPNGQYAGPWF